MQEELVVGVDDRLVPDRDQPPWKFPLRHRSQSKPLIALIVRGKFQARSIRNLLAVGMRLQHDQKTVSSKYLIGFSQQSERDTAPPHRLAYPRHARGGLPPRDNRDQVYPMPSSARHARRQGHGMRSLRADFSCQNIEVPPVIRFGNVAWLGYEPLEFGKHCPPILNRNGISSTEQKS
ncbi:hypothetical protein D3C71_1088810 [compost metagenome]